MEWCINVSHCYCGAVYHLSLVVGPLTLRDERSVCLCDSYSDLHILGLKLLADNMRIFLAYICSDTAYSYMELLPLSELERSFSVLDEHS